jgi:hypothetical protein
MKQKVAAANTFGAVGDEHLAALTYAPQVTVISLDDHRAAPPDIYIVVVIVIVSVRWSRVVRGRPDKEAERPAVVAVMMPMPPAVVVVVPSVMMVVVVPAVMTVTAAESEMLCRSWRGDRERGQCG